MSDFVWYRNGTKLTGQTGSTLTIGRNDFSGAATYKVEVGGGEFYDTMTIIHIQDGEDGQDGADGQPGVDGIDGESAPIAF
jgi:hypothetical protein